MASDNKVNSKMELTTESVVMGPIVSPVDRIKLYSPNEWEEFIKEWAESLKSDYYHVERLGGAGDMGRDIVASTGDPATCCPWDNYQCKHYDHSLMPGDIWVELGKLCYYTFIKEFTLPRKYYFVAPQGIGTKLYDLLSKPIKIKKELISIWDKKCKDKIAAKNEIQLDGKFKEYVEDFDFSIVWYKKISEIIERHRKTNLHIARFGGGLPLRPAPESPPSSIQSKEVRYVRQLLDAYGDAANTQYSNPDELNCHKTYRSHFDRSRERFYCAESLRVFSNDTLPQGEFDKLQEEIYDGVVDIAESSHSNGYERVKATTNQATTININSHPLKSCLKNNDKSGICHQLANNNRLVWVPQNDKNK